MADELPEIAGTQDILEEMRRQELRGPPRRINPRAPQYVQDPSMPEGERRLSANELPPLAPTDYERIDNDARGMRAGFTVNPIEFALGVVPGPGMARLPRLPTPKGGWRSTLPAEEISRLEALPGQKLPDYIDRIAEARANGWPTVYHGTPHAFRPEPGYPLGRFDPNRVLTGEGFNSFGHAPHGYHAENEAVARGYRDVLAAVHAKPMKPMTPEWAAQTALDVHGGDFAKARAELAENLARTESMAQLNPHTREKFAPDTERYRAALRILDEGGPPRPPPGHMIESILRARPEEFMDFYKPLSEQSEMVRRALGAPQGAKAAEAEALAKRIHALNGEIDRGGPRADAAMREKDALVEQYLKIDPNEAAWWKYDNAEPYARPEIAQRLSELGVPGVRYPDRQSRPAGQGTHNYAVWSPIVDPLRQYARGGGMAS